MHASNPITVEYVDGVAPISPIAWDALVSPDNFYNSYRWLRGLEGAVGRHAVVVARSGGRLVGAVPTWPGEHNAPGSLFCLADMLPGLGRRWEPEWLWLGGYRSVYNEVLAVHGPGRHRVLGELLEGALALAAGQGRAGLAMPYLNAEDARELAVAHPRANAIVHSADANITIPVGGYEEFLARMSQRDRTRRRAELRAVERSGTTITWAPMTRSVADLAAPLIAQNRARYGSPAGTGWMRRAFAAQYASHVLEDAYACLATRDDRVIAVNVCYPFADRLYARYFGFDYTSAAPACEYFAVVYSAPLTFGAAGGYRRYRLAISAWDLKIRRGAVLSPLAVVVLPLSGSVTTPAQASACTASACRHWRELTARHPDALSPGWAYWPGV
jgi:predicted N-acyltransferase